ncbi:glycosyltransferase family 4 protein [Candidatus Parcubacteria bacterium]|nr:glycosyltransferase family 4 protein [Candidatus Parcubacteria bacterium]
MERKLTINFLVLRSWLTGGTRVIMELINVLTDMGHEVNLVSLGDPKELDWIELKGNKIFAGRTLIQKIFGFLYRMAFGYQPWPEEQTRLLMKAMPKADINVATMSYSVYAAYRSPHGVPFQFFMHNEPLVREEGYYKKVMAESYYLPTKKIVNSTWLKHQLKEVYNQEAVGMVFPGLDHKIFYSRDNKKPKNKSQKIKILSLAKYKWWKGTPDALKAIQIVRDAGYNIEFILFGNFDPKTLPDEVKHIEFSFVGSKKNDELADLYRESDILISSSFFESFPYPQLEAMACGTPVVTTQFGTEDYAFDHQNALVIEPKNPEQMAKAIMELIDNPDMYSRFIEEGLKTAQKFTWEKAAQDFAAILIDSLI